MRNKRDSLEIVSSLIDILDGGPCGKTSLASRANLDTRAAERYIDFLLQNSLISMDDARFKLKDKGRDFRSEYYRLKQFISHSIA
jgi:predicted transcriptional regulator